MDASYRFATRTSDCQAAAGCSGGGELGRVAEDAGDPGESTGSDLPHEEELVRDILFPADAKATCPDEPEPRVVVLVAHDDAEGMTGCRQAPEPVRDEPATDPGALPGGFHRHRAETEAADDPSLRSGD